jgi:O-acetyl-ADP-ribose deacetylase (regulator of RNase III)
MVKVVVGNLFDSKAQTLVNTVNCVGVMGKGVALEFRKRFPDMYEDYVRRCAAGEVRLGRPYLYRPPVPPYILNFPTKNHWRSPSRLDDIVQGLEYLKEHYREWGITSLAVPPLGSGHGQLEWRVVGPTLYQKLKELEIPVELYAPFETPHEELQPSFLDRGSDAFDEGLPPSRVDPAWAALIEILERLEREPYHWPIGRVSFQKIAYFATERGIPTGLDYQRGSYGPFAPNLKSVIGRLMNNGLIREKPLGRMLEVRVGPTYPSARAAFREALGEWSDAIDEVVDLFTRLRTHDAELAATVHFAWKELRERMHEFPTEADVLREVMEWKIRRRPPLEDREVAETIRNLSMLGWIEVRASRELPIDEDELVGTV